PFGVDGFLAGLRATVRRVIPGQDEPVVTTPHFSLDFGAKRATDADGGEIRLTPTEWGIVEVLCRNRGKLVPQRQLLQEVWGPQYETETPYLRVYMAAIRRKLEPESATPRYVITEPGLGYRFQR